MQFIGNRYDILDYNGEIEVGKLYKARDAYSNNIVYVKLINNSELIKETFKPDLIDESTVVNHIALPQIAKVYINGIHCTEFELYYYIVYEYFEGQTLKDYIYNNNLSKKSIVNITSQIIRAIESTNLVNLYHGGLNANNILIDKDENIKIYDYGITKANDGVNPRLNDDINYLCPHQLNIDYTDISSDFFALGIILFEMMFREMPFGYDACNKERLKNVDKDIKWHLLIYNDEYTDILNIIKKLLSRKNKYKNTGEILVDLSGIMYEQANIDTVIEETDNIYELKTKKKSSKVLVSMFIALLTVMIVVSSF